jgi:phosphatidylglycerophosphate synthase
MWLAHALTLARLPLIAVFFATDRGVWWAVAIGVAAVTDALDGRVARSAQGRRPPPWPAWWNIGAWLDPLVDKLFILGVLAALVVHDPTDAALVALVGTRELLLVPLLGIYELVRRHRPRLPVKAHTIGKATTIVQLVSLAAIVERVPGAPILAVACAILGAVTVIHYIAAAISVE